MYFIVIIKGDGRAIALGEYSYTIDDGMKQKEIRSEIQMKGAGLTPFSRFADGRAVLRSSIREYLMSESMHFLGIPSTRCAMLIASDEHKVMRDEFYDGRANAEKTAIVVRISSSFLRFGSFEICSSAGGPSFQYNNNNHSHSILKPLLDYVIRHHYSHIWNKMENNTNENESDLQMYEQWWKELVDKTVQLTVDWQTFGFVHGVLNTDNMSIIGQTIDYGPFGFMEYFDPHFVPNFSDKNGRYSYENQVEMCEWNLQRLADVLHESQLIDKEITCQYLNKAYFQLFDDYFLQRIAAKFGLKSSSIKLKEISDLFFLTLQETNCDLTNAFRSLQWISGHGINDFLATETEMKLDFNDSLIECRLRENTKLVEYLVTQCMTPAQFALYQKRSKSSSNPVDNELLFQQLSKALALLKGNEEVESIGGLTADAIEMYLNRLQLQEKANQNVNVNEMTADEKKEKDGELWTKFVDIYRTAVDDEISFIPTKEALQEWNDSRARNMNNINPRYILRNHMLQKAIVDAENGEYQEINKLLKLIETPFDEQDTDERYTSPVLEQIGWQCSCSS